MSPPCRHHSKPGPSPLPPLPAPSPWRPAPCSRSPDPPVSGKKADTEIIKWPRGGTRLEVYAQKDILCMR
jgi:hypothetical protein